MNIVRSVFRRKARAFLTIFGITIGVLALVVMGAMAEKLNLLVDGGMKYYGDKVTVTDAGAGGTFGGPLSVRKIRSIEQVKGVARASASIGMMLDKEQGASVGVPPMIMGGDGRATGYEKFVITYASGREIKTGELGTVALGSDIATKLDAGVGDTVKLRDKSFRVVGVMDKTLTAPDQCAYVNLADAQDLFVKDLPAAVRDRVDPRDLCTSIAVYVKEGVDAESLALRIGLKDPTIKAAGPHAFEESVGQQMAMFNSIIFGVAMVSLLIGGLSVVNTMTMAVSERTREIGIRKAIGASSAAVIGQFVGESAVIGFVGGVVGLILGGFIALGLNAAATASASNEMFLVTTRLGAGSVLFALVLGVIAGIYPAVHAANLNPVRALRYE